jgi:type I restriction enzyme M protein
MINKPVLTYFYGWATELRWSSFKNIEPQAMFDLFTRPSVGGLSVFEHMKE